MEKLNVSISIKNQIFQVLDGLYSLNMFILNLSQQSHFTCARKYMKLKIVFEVVWIYLISRECNFFFIWALHTKHVCIFTNT